jgi:hypothetical protein
MHALRIFEFALSVVAFILLIGGAVLWLRSEARRKDEDRSHQINAELETLVDARGERIADLETALESERAERRSEAQKFREELAELRGQVEAIRHLKAEEIADAVVQRLRP